MNRELAILSRRVAFATAAYRACPTDETLSAMLAARSDLFVARVQFRHETATSQH